MAENHETKNESERIPDHPIARRIEFREITAELWRIQDEMDSLKSCMWRALHRLGRALEQEERAEEPFTPPLEDYS